MPNSETFKISAALKDLIGKELITDEFVAVFELVKNSFDANATKVEVRFENNHDHPKSDKIIISDNGKGMNYDDLKNKWLFVAYSAKRLGKENDDYRDKIKVNRIFAGAKGVGRFSCDRLGRYLNMVTIKDEANPKIENLKVNWEDFENSDEEEFVNINVSHDRLKTSNFKYKHGTSLEISGLRDDWDRERILSLKRSLVKLINPNQENDSQNFSIEIVAEDEKPIDLLPNKKNEKRSDWEIVNGTIRNSVFETLEIKTSNILVNISEDGKYIETTLQDRGDLIYYLKEKNPFQELHNIKVYLFQLNYKAKQNFHRIMGMRSVEYGSVFMYKNGFRVYPFGEEGEDILLIDRRKQQGYNRFLGTRDLIGRIEIDGDQPELREITSRDGGLVKTSTYYQLVDFFYEYVLKRLENYVVNVIRWGDEKLIKETGELLPELWPKDVKVEILGIIAGFINSKNIIDIQYDKDFLEIISEKQNKSVDKIVKNITNVAEKSGNPDLIKEAKKIEKAIKETKEDSKKAQVKAANEEKLRKESEEKLEYVIGQNNFLKDEISDDTKNLESILHHIGLTTNFIRMDIEDLVKSINRGDNKDKILQIVKRISSENLKVTSFAKYFKKVNFNIHSNKVKKDIVAFINEYIENVYRKREDLISNRELLNVNFDVPKTLKFTMEFNPIDLIIIIDNLTNNSLKNGAKSIHITWVEINKQETLLKFSDDGKGVKDSIVDQIFDFGFTTTRGSGLGLYHIRDIMKKMKSTIEVNNNIKPGVEFLLTFKK
ncbi:ATP-binding protein [Flagellimonas marina]|uniref:ATP-binding protein n=1 Tax=Flagellimonas marina TaxID=1775168 RepID=A0ABV8PI81_9FLAO